MGNRIERKKWILYRHTNNFDLITAVAVNLKYFSKTSISREDKRSLLLKLKDLDYYKERNPELPLDSINHRINTLAYYMFGYKGKVNNEDKFLFSPLGNLFLKNLDDKLKLSKIFFTMLWGLQYEHPHGGSDKMFKLYPFRLLFKLLGDQRIDNKLYVFEVANNIVFTETIDENEYERLVKSILATRNLANDEIIKIVRKDEHTYVNSIYEWDYYLSKFLEAAGIVTRTTGRLICTLTHGTDTTRRLKENFVSLNSSLYNLFEKLNTEFPYYEIPLPLNDPERLKLDVIKEIYSFYPKVLLEEIGEAKSDLKLELLNLPKLIEQYSNNTEGEEAYLFEEALTSGFNQFYNVEAQLVGGAGNTDVECLFITKKKKFAVDAKSTKNKLSDINSGRLRQHREKIGGDYTIVITPRYVPAVLHDIKSTPIVIIRASTFSEYLYNCINNDVRKIDFNDFDKIIISNLGTDISRQISTLTLERFAAAS
jgi:hypothetical protein